MSSEATWNKGRQSAPGAELGDVKPVDFFKGGGLDVKAVRDYVLSGKTAFGRLFSPLVAELDKLPIRDSPDTGMYIPDKRAIRTFEHFKLIHDFLQGRDTSNIELTREDILFLLTDRSGNFLRRPVLKKMFAETLDKEIACDSEREQKVKAIIVKSVAAEGWTEYIHGRDSVLGDIKVAYPPEEIWIDTRAAGEEFRLAVKESGQPS